MKIGLLWFDDDPRRQLEEKVLRAARHYERKYGRPPNLCFVHPSTLNGNGGKRGRLRANGVEIRPGRSILPDHFWLGVAEDQSHISNLTSRISNPKSRP
ncbi:MAG: hypothetical protein DRI79_01880 [Chloroflexi bacterium]|nr:MAG: hypothetical protein DRI80_15275 [Chloroflexota bacterium]RLC91856.1 MAG: hypothetical protein DRI79_01880 [Chloroflexota bacterium]HEY66654.1 hypothetical protein [Thermoflexia bacterium]